jgi:hypothetical protein
VRRHLRLHHDGNEDSRRVSQFHAVETWLRDSDNGHRVTVEGNHSADDGAVTVEVTLPEAIAEYHHRLAVGNRVVVRGDGAAQCRPDAQDREIGAGDQLRGYLPRTITVAKGYGGWEPAEHPREDLIVVAQIFKHRPGNGVWAVTVAVVVAGFSDDHKPLRMTNGQEPKNDLIQQAKHRGVCADPERQRGHRNQGESWILGKGPQGIPKILHQLVHEGSHSHVTT